MKIVSIITLKSFHRHRKRITDSASIHYIYKFIFKYLSMLDLGHIYYRLSDQLADQKLIGILNTFMLIQCTPYIFYYKITHVSESTSVKY